MISFLKTALTGVVAFAAISAAAQDPVTFADFSPSSSDRNIRYFTQAGAGRLVDINSPIVLFDLLFPSNLPVEFDGEIEAVFELDATSTGALVASGGFLSQTFNGTLSYTAVTPIEFNGISYSNLLTISFTNAVLFGQPRANSVVFNGSTASGTVDFSSDVYDFTTSTDRDFSIAITGLSPSLLQLGTNFRNFRGSASGNFSANPPPIATVVVPEPATWAMLITGFALVGLRSRRRGPASVAA